MAIYFIVVAIFVYIMGILAYCDIEDPFDQSLVKTARMSLLWPLFFVLVILKAFLYVINGIVKFLCLLAGFHYERTKLYYWIDSISDN